MLLRALLPAALPALTLADQVAFRQVNRGDTLNTILEHLGGTEESVISDTSFAVEEKWFTQIKDHFEALGTNSATWQQRYFVNTEHHKPGGPVFLMIGGEGEISSAYVGPRFFTSALAKEFRGAVVALEHRFYGKSQPFASGEDALSTTHLALLSSRQALSDLAVFIASLKSPGGAFEGSKFMCLGGSYPGNLAAWFREVYPESTVGCFSFSAPVFAKSDFFEYGQVVHRAINSAALTGGAEDMSDKLLNGYRTIFSDLKAGTKNMRNSVLKNLRACPYSVLSSEDEANVESMVTSALAGVVQYNNTRPAGEHIEDYVRLIKAAPTAEEAAWQVTAKLMFENKKDASKTPGASDCIDYSTRSSYLQFKAAGEKLDDFAAARSWVYQTCAEFGYFQTSRAGVHNKTLYTEGVSDPSLWAGLCEQIFGIESVDTNIAKTRAFYNRDLGLTTSPPNTSLLRNKKNMIVTPTNKNSPTHTVFINGANDPWSSLSWGVFSHREKELSGHVIGGASHCVGIYGSPEDPAVIPEAQEVQRGLIETAKRWLGESSSISRTSNDAPELYQ